MKTVSRTYCPAAISLIYRAWSHEDLLQMGSTGVGFTIDKGVTAAVSLSKESSIVFNNEEIEFPTVKMVVDELTKKPVTIQLTTSLLLGVGFGLSGASALSTAYALNDLLGLGKNVTELTKIAHRTEIVNKTGLGTVTTQSLGGFLLKTTPGVSPDYKRLRFEGKKLYSVVFGKLKTNTVLGGKQQKNIDNAADIALAEIANIKNPTLPKIIDVSHTFAAKSHLLQSEKVKKTISHIENNGGSASMHMLGEAVVSNTNIELEYGGALYELHITNDTVRLL